jgi:hypothetical protein
MNRAENISSANGSRRGIARFGERFSSRWWSFGIERVIRSLSRGFRRRDIVWFFGEIVGLLIKDPVSKCIS